METKNKNQAFQGFIDKIEEIRKGNEVDLSTAEDLSIAVMNLISLEEHFFFTAMKTRKNEYLDIAAEVRKQRKELLAELMPNHEGETWCASKHLLSASMRLIEVGNKLHSENDKVKAVEMFERAYHLYSIFWSLKLRLVDVKTITKESVPANRLEDIVSKLADCCKE